MTSPTDLKTSPLDKLIFVEGEVPLLSYQKLAVQRWQNDNGDDGTCLYRNQLW